MMWEKAINIAIVDRLLYTRHDAGAVIVWADNTWNVITVGEATNYNLPIYFYA